MINYKQILEAINRGILLALDDFDDEEQVLHIKSKQVLNRDYTKEYLDFMKDVIDLGLPSGTCWFKYNLGVDYKKLDKMPEKSIPEDWYGDYYAWGETEPKDEYTLKTYKFSANKITTELTKYCNKSLYGHNNFADNLTLLLPEDDAAYLNMHLYDLKFHIPTSELFEELLKYTKHYWKNNYNGITNLNGLVFENNKGSIFFPASGWDTILFEQDGGHLLHDIKIRGYYLTSTLTNNGFPSQPDSSLHFMIDEREHVLGLCGFGRKIGCSIRPVINL